MKREFLYLSGFFKDDGNDDSLQFGLEVPAALQPAVLKAVGWSSLSDSQGNGWELNNGQIAEISRIIGEELPNSLSIYIETLTAG